MKIHFILYVQDQETSRVFYEHILNCAPTLHVPGMTEFTIADGTVIGLMPEQGVARLLNLDPTEVAGASIRGEIHLVIQSPEAYFQRALAAGARQLSPLALRDWGDQAAYCLDPNGYIIAFASQASTEASTSPAH